MKLRKYQEEARDSVISEWANGNLNTMIAMATGTGKTETFLSVLAAEREAGRMGRALIIAHRQELIYQPSDRIGRHWSDKLPDPGIVMAKHDGCDRELVVATIQTLSSERRLERLLEHGQFTHIITDECHHAPADSYIALYNQLRSINPSLRHLGVTATPKRSDGAGLRKVYNSVAYKISIKDAIVRLKCLSPFVALAFNLPVDISGVPILGDDYEQGALGSVMSVDNALEIVVKKWQEHASARPTMAFTSGVKHAELLSATFNAAGITAAWASGETKKTERERIIDDYMTGKIQVLVNCNVWTEGFDAPHTACILNAKPTRSDSVYVQAVGRGLRLHPGKTDCLIIDFVPKGARDLMLAGDLLGKPKEQKAVEAKAQDEGAIISAFGIASDGTGIDGDPDSVIVRALDYFASQSKLRWTFDGGVGTVSINRGESLAIVLPDNQRKAKADELRESGQWSDAWAAEYERICSYSVYAVNGRPELLGVAGDWEEATMIADDYYEQHGDPTLARKASKWRKLPATEKQVVQLKKRNKWTEGLRRGESAQILTHIFAMDSLRRGKVIK